MSNAIRLAGAGSVMLFLIASGCAAGSARRTDWDTGATRQITYEVFGMDCPACHGGLEKNLRKVPGVFNASANWKEERVTLTVPADVEPEPDLIEKAIRDSNFTPGRRLP